MTNARRESDLIAALLRSEHHALAEVILALAEFDRQRGWEALGHPNFFSFLHRELGLSKGSAFYRKVAAELVQRHPEVIAPLRDGRLCITSVVELAKVLTPENRDEVLPRFFHRSKQEAKAISAELRPQEVPARREVVTVLVPPTTAQTGYIETAVTTPSRDPVRPVEPVVPAPAAERPSEPPRQRDDVEPISGDRRRLHITVSREFLETLEAAKDALSHARPGASTEEILKAGLDLLLQRHARRKGLVEKPQRAPRPSRTDAVPAHVKREVWRRAGGKCEWRLDSGATCGCTKRLEFDHIVPRAHGGPSTIENVRLLCRAHNLLAARLVFGDAWMDRYSRAAPPRDLAVGRAASPAGGVG